MCSEYTLAQNNQKTWKCTSANVTQVDKSETDVVGLLSLQAMSVYRSTDMKPVSSFHSAIVEFALRDQVLSRPAPVHTINTHSYHHVITRPVITFAEFTDASTIDWGKHRWCKYIQPSR